MVALRRPVQMLQFTLDGGAVLPVHDDGDRAGALLDELDDLIVTLDAALAEQVAARTALGEADRTARVTEARIALVRAAIAVEVRS